MDGKGGGGADFEVIMWRGWREGRNVSEKERNGMSKLVGSGNEMRRGERSQEPHFYFQEINI